MSAKAELRLKTGPLVELAWRDFWRHPKAGNGQEGRLRLFLLNHFPALAYLVAMVLLVIGTYWILGVREATDRQYLKELSNPFIWWASVHKDPRTKIENAGGSLLPEHFWREEIPYVRHILHLVPQGSSHPREAVGRSYKPDDPVLEQAAANLVWPRDPEAFLAAARARGRYGIIVTRFLYERILDYDEVPDFPRVDYSWSRRERPVPIPVLGIVEYLPNGEYLISEEFVESFVSRTWRERLFPRQVWVWRKGDENKKRAVELTEQAASRLRSALEDLQVEYESLKVVGLRGRPALFLSFPREGIPRVEMLEALWKSDLLEESWEHKTETDDAEDTGDSIRYNRVAYVVEQDVDLVAEMIEYCREQGLEVDASILLRAGALVRGREHFLRQSRMVLWLNWAAALGLLATVMLYKTHQGIHNFGVYVAIGGRASDGYQMAAIQFFGILIALLIPVTASSFLMTLMGGREKAEFYAFYPWDLGYGTPLLGMAAAAFGAIVLVRAYLHHRLWPAQMILYRE